MLRVSRRFDQHIDQSLPCEHTYLMGAVRKITVNVPADVLDEATRITGKGVTATVIEGLTELRRRDMRSALRRLKGKVRFSLDLEATRR